MTLPTHSIKIGQVSHPLSNRSIPYSEISILFTKVEDIGLGDSQLVTGQAMFQTI